MVIRCGRIGLYQSCFGHGDRVLCQDCRRSTVTSCSTCGTNDNATIDQISAFVAGGIGDHFGGFTQWTYDGVGRAFSWDNLDLRATDHVTVDGTDLLLGVSLNNAPSVQDAWNTTPA